MAGVVQPGLSDTGLLQEGLLLVLVAARIDRLAVGLSEHPIALVPLAASQLPLTVLDLAVLRDESE